MSDAAKPNKDDAAEAASAFAAAAMGGTYIPHSAKKPIFGKKTRRAGTPGPFHFCRPLTAECMPSRIGTFGRSEFPTD